MRSLLLFLILFIPKIVFAHLISVTPLATFPSQMTPLTSATAQYRVTNITSSVSITAINASQFPAGFSVFASTCGNLMSPGQSCLITLRYQATTPQNVSTQLLINASPALDGVAVPIAFTVIATPSQFTVTPSAGPNGSIAPNTVQSVSSGGSIQFTATPDSGYAVSQWLVDGVVVPGQTGTTYTLTNVNANHTVQVTFALQSQDSVAFLSGAFANQLYVNYTLDAGANWITGNITNPQTFTAVRKSACSKGGAQARCGITGTITNSGNNFIASSNNGAQDWDIMTLALDVELNTGGLAAFGQGSEAVLVVSGGRNFMGAKLGYLAVNKNGTWSYPIIANAPADNVNLYSVSCTGAGSGKFCIAAGNTQLNVNPFTTNPIIAVSDAGVNTWSYSLFSQPDEGFTESSCIGTSYCAVIGETNSDSRIAYTTNSGTTWQYSSDPAVAGRLSSISCAGTTTPYCVAVGQLNFIDAQIIYSTNQGAWNSATVNGNINNVSLASVSCSESSLGIPVCAAVGDAGVNTPAIYTSIDSGANWTARTVVNPTPSLTNLNKVSCGPYGTQVYCLAVGNNNFILESNDNGVTWTQTDSPSAAIPSGFLVSSVAVGITCKIANPEQLLKTLIKY